MKNRRAILSVLILSAAFVAWPPSPARCQETLEDFFTRFRSINRLTEENLNGIRLHRWNASPQLVESTRQNLARLRESFHERGSAFESELKASPDSMLGSIRLELALSNITDALEIHQQNVARYQSKKLAARLAQDAQEYRSLARQWRTRLLSLAERESARFQTLNSEVSRLRAEVGNLRKSLSLATRQLMQCDTALREARAARSRGR